MDSLFPTLPEDLSALTDEELSTLLEEHRVAADKIEAEDAEYTAGYDGPGIIAELSRGNEQVEQLLSLQAERVEAHERYQAEKAALAARIRGDEPVEEPVVEEPAALAVEETEPEIEAVVEEPATVVAAVEPPRPSVYRRTPSPSQPIRVIEEPHPVAALVASASARGVQPGTVLADRMALAQVISKTALALGRPHKSQNGGEERTLVASARIPYPEDRTLKAGDHDGNLAKIQGVGSPWLGQPGLDVLTASGGLCAPLTPFYTQPNLSTAARPVRDSLPNFMADRGGISVPTPGTIADITTAISLITEEEDALGGTYATKSCQDFSCPTWTDVAVTVIAHCREYGNLNAMAWPEGIAFQNDLTMAAHARVSDGYLLTRIGSLSVAKTWDQSAESYGALSGLIQALLQERAATISYLRMPPGTRFRALLPFWVAEALAVDTVNTQFDRFELPQDAISRLLGRYNIDVTWYLDTADGAGQVYSSSSAGAIVDFLDPVGYLFPEGTFLHVDSGDLELGIVRDSTLNSTNDFQVFGETFENVARIGPEQAAKKITFSNFCPSGAVAAPKTAITC